MNNSRSISKPKPSQPQGLPRIRPGTRLLSLMWVRYPRPTRTNFQPGPYWVRRAGEPGSAWVCRWIHEHAGFEAVCQPGDEFCAIPEPQDPREMGLDPDELERQGKALQATLDEAEAGC